MAKNDLNQKHEVAQLSTLLAVASESGLSLVGALYETFSHAEGEVAARFKRLLVALELGGNIFDELSAIRSKAGNGALADLVVKLQVSLQFGSPLSDQLMQFAKSLRQQVAQAQLTQAAKKENLMLMPLVFLILPVTVLFALFPALQYLNIAN